MRSSRSIAIALLIIACSFLLMARSPSQDGNTNSSNKNVNQPKETGSDKETSNESKTRPKKGRPTASPSP